MIPRSILMSLRNLASDPRHGAVLNQLRKALAECNGRPTITCRRAALRTSSIERLASRCLRARSSGNRQAGDRLAI
jgi:hypothetical protein